MLKTRSTSLFQAWVKNVYSLCVEGVVNSAQSYTGNLLSALQTINIGVQPASFTHTIDSFAPALYTVNFPYLPPTTYHLSTLSTTPITKKTKKSKKGIQ